MSNEKQKKPKSKYSFCRRWSHWAVYNDETGSKVCDYLEREDARKKVYEVNGWKYNKNK